MAFLILLFCFPIEPGKEKAPLNVEEVVPAKFARHRRYPPQLDLATAFTLQAVSRIGIGGAILSLACSILVFALEEGGVDFPWSSVIVIATLTVSVVCFIRFVLWEEWIIRAHSRTVTAAIEPQYNANGYLRANLPNAPYQTPCHCMPSGNWFPH